jgi:hypothetical protein
MLGLITEADMGGGFGIRVWNATTCDTRATTYLYSTFAATLISRTETTQGVQASNLVDKAWPPRSKRYHHRRSAAVTSSVASRFLVAFLDNGGMTDSIRVIAQRAWRRVRYYVLPSTGGRRLNQSC